MTAPLDVSRAPGARMVRRWPLFLIASPAAVAIWSGWVALGGLCGFGLVQPFPGIVAWHLDTAITLPVGVEAYGAYALGAWLTPGTPDRARKFARRSAIGSLGLGMAGQVIFHLLAAAHAVRAPWPVVVVVSCMPVITLGFGAALTHLLRVPVAAPEDDETVQDEPPADTPGADQPEAADDETVPPAVPAADRDDETGDPRPEPGGSDVARLFAEQMEQVRALPLHNPVASEAAPEPGNGTMPPGASSAALSERAGMVSAMVPADAEGAAEASLRATLAAGNPWSLNQLQSRFSLTRAQAAKVRGRVLVAANGHDVVNDSTEADS